MRRRKVIEILGVSPLAWSLAARGQQSGRTYRLAILDPAGPVNRVTGKRDRRWSAFFEELGLRGYEEGRSLVVAWHSSEGDAQRVAELARDIVQLKPDVIFSADSRMLTALKRATASIPVVAVAANVVGMGFASSLARPGGNITGFDIGTGSEIFGKRLELLKEAVPSASRTAWLGPRRVFDLYIGAFREAARSAGLTLVDAVLEAPVGEAEYRRVFAIIVRDGADSLWVAPSAENLAHQRLIAELAVGARLPSMFVYRESVEAGGLMCYGPELADLYRRSAGYIDRILKGANPAELPFQQPSKFELVINLKTAKALGLTIPPTLLARADELIE